METDFLIIGAGVAGLRAAIEASEAGNVLVLTKDRLTESSSEYAQGGIAVALADDDEVSLHEQDTVQAGAGLCNPDAVKALVEEGPPRIQQLIDWGVEFDREGGRLEFTREGAHSRNRVLHALVGTMLFVIGISYVYAFVSPAPPGDRKALLRPAAAGAGRER